MDWIYLALGLTASASFIAGNYILNRSAMLAVQILGMSAVSIQYGLLGIWSVVAVNAILLIRNLILWKGTWTPRATATWGWIFAAVLLATVAATGTWPTSFLTALPVLAAILNVVALAASRLPLLKAGLGASSTAWLIMDLSYGNWQNAIGDTFGIIAAAAALIRIAYDRRKAAPLQ